ncbi:DUF6165 family protein [Tropicimonas marinistellae]|uniref:DUF6165 family protein n=1 Tax=Tropicimonas marinistellae TaxID=1739787 RepID=UPI0008295931|nr:DUF6165 family protein [Tropicimonas marinistellae]
MRVDIPVSFGELIDKITILEIKCRQIEDTAKRALAEAELAELRAILDALPRPEGYAALKQDLFDANMALWVAEDRIRACDAAGEFGPEFIALAQSIYRQNDRRFRIKTRLSQAAGSVIREVKSHVPT